MIFVVIFFIGFCLLSICIISVCLRHAVHGYENERGFHTVSNDTRTVKNLSLQLPRVHFSEVAPVETVRKIA